MNMKNMIFVFIVIVNLFLTGCATMFSRNHQNISINSTPSGANVRVFDGNRLVFEGTTPTIFRVNRMDTFDKSHEVVRTSDGTRTRSRAHNKNFRVTITKNGYESVDYTLSTGFSNAFLADSAIGLGSIGIGALMGGFGYDDINNENNSNSVEIGLGLIAFGATYSALCIVPLSMGITGADGRSRALRPSSINARLRAMPGVFDEARDLDQAVNRAVLSMQNDIPENSQIVVLNITSNSASVSSDLIDMVSFNLLRSHNVRLINRNALETLRAEQRFQFSDEVNDRTAVEIGNILGADIVITGRVSGTGADRRLIVQALDIHSARVVSIAVEDQARSPFVRAVGVDSAIQRAVRAITDEIPANTSIAVLPPTTTVSNTILHDLIAYNLHTSKKFNLVNRQDVDVIQLERRFQLSGEVDNSVAIEFGRLVGASTVVTGSLISVNNQVRFIVQAIDIETAKVLSIAVEGVSQPSDIVRTMDTSVNRAITSMAREIPENTTIAVLNIEATNNTIASHLIDLTMHNLHRTNRFTLVNRQSLDVLRRERNFQFAGDFDVSSAVEIGRMIGAGVVITGRMINYQNQQRLILQALDTQTAQVVSMEIADENNAVTVASRGVDGAVRRITATMINDIPNGSNIAVLDIASAPPSAIEAAMLNLHRSGNFNILNRAALNTVRTEQRFHFTNEVDDNTAISMGRLIGANVVITGRLISYANQQRLILQALDTQTAKVWSIGIADDNIDLATAPRGLDGAMRRAISTMANDIPAGSHIAVLNVGSAPDSAIDMVMLNLHNTRRFTLVNRAELNTLREEQRFQLAGEVDDNTAVSLGRLMGANVVITGSVIGSGAQQRLILQALDTQTALVVGMAMENVQ
jgi:curli biogenesis system outer membrane secretion channel CsgG